MARIYCRFLAALALAVALAHARTPALAQGNLYPPGYDGAAAGGNGVQMPVNPNGVNNYGTAAPMAPTTPARPASWPGGSQDPAAIRSGGPPGSGPPQAEAVPEAPKKDLTQPPYEPAAILARVGSEVVQATEVLPATHQTLDAFLVKLGSEWDKLPDDVKKEKRDQWQRELVQKTLEDLINFKLLLAELKSTVPPEAVKKNEDRIRKDFNENEIKKLMTQYKVASVIELENKLREHGGSLESQRNAYVGRYMAISWLHQQVKAQKEPTHEEMVTYYREHAADWERPARARWEELTARFDKFASKDAAHRSLAQWGNEVFRGAPFAQVAKAHSQSFSAEEGGLNDWTTKGSLRSTTVDEAVFRLPVGQLSRIFEDDEGLHIVRVIEREDQRQIPFNEVQTDIKKRLKEGDHQRNMNEYLAKLREHTPVYNVFDSEDGSAMANRPSSSRR